MSDDEIVNYCRKLIIANLNQYIDTQNGNLIVSQIIELQTLHDNASDKLLLEHCNGIKNLLEKCIDILESRNEKL